MNIPDNYIFTINDFNKLTINDKDSYTDKIKTTLYSVNTIDDNVYFKGQSQIIVSMDETIEEDDDIYELYKPLKDAAIFAYVQGILDFSFTIPVKTIIAAFNKHEDLINSDIIDCNYNIVDMFFGRNFDENETEKVLKLSNQYFIDYCFNEFKYYINCATIDSGADICNILSFLNPEFDGLSFSDELLRKFN